MGVDYEQQLKDNAAAMETELQNSNAAYDKTISDYQAVVDAKQQQLDSFKEEQSRLQQEQTDFAIDKIEQEREQTEKNYTKEQQAAYGDYKRQTDPYGVNAEQMAALGLSRSGYSESSNVAMYTAYQNRVATARATFEQAKLTFDNAIREAKLTNDINLAQIAQQALEQSLALSMDSIVQLGSWELQKAEAASSIKDKYYNREQDILEAQRAEIAAAQQEQLIGLLQGDSVISGDEVTEESFTTNRYAGAGGNAAIYGGTGGGGNAAVTGQADFSAVDAFIGDSVPKEEIDYVVSDMVDAGIITSENVNGVNVYKVADEAKAKAYLSGQGASATSSQATASGPAGQSKYTYSDERVNAYFEQKDAVEALQKEYAKAKSDLALLEGRQAATDNPRANYGSADFSAAVAAQQAYVDDLKAQLDTASRKLALMPKVVESSQYKTLNASYKDAKKEWETATSELNGLNGSGVSKGVITTAENKVKKSKKAMDDAYAKLMSVEQYTVEQGGYRPT